MEKPPCMSYAEFRPLLSASADMYLEYIKEKKGYAGKKVISVTDISPASPDFPSNYYFVTSEKVTHPDYCQVWVNDEYISSIKILTVMHPRKGVHAIRVCDEDNYLRQFPRLTADSIKIVSDLSFLISRLDRFYARHSFSFQPPAPQELPPLDAKYTAPLSDEQLHAVNGVCSSPVSYVSGAPGTGKTRMVLSRCVLRYILNGKRVFLLAPTNNAIEQMLRSILPILKESGVDLRIAYRIGTSSEEFASEYPQVVGDTVLETLKSDLEQQRRVLESELKAVQKHMRDQLREQYRYRTCKSAHDRIAVLFEQLEDQKEIASNERSAHLAASKNLKAKEAEHASAVGRLDAAKAKLRACERLISQNNLLIERLRYRFWRRKQRDKLLLETKELLAQSLQFQSECQTLSEELSAAVKNLTQAKEDHESAQSRVTEAEDRSAATVKEIRSEANCDEKYRLLVANALCSSSKHPLSEVEQYISDLEANCQITSVKSVDSIQSELGEVLRQLNEISASSKLQQKKKALVLAGTIDASLDSLIPDDEAEPAIPVSHVFLDEAGYTSLARGMAAFACGAPVTFLGDHRQLPPVCEMNSIDPAHAPVCLWALSVAYFSELVYSPFDSLYYGTFRKKSEPSFSCVTYFELNTSYRFGSLLADILAKYIYSDHFSGVDGAPFEILALDAPEYSGTLPRTNQSEANAIFAYLKNNPNEDFVILTPYRNQLKLIQRTLPRQYRDSILTVHRSQGREWDTVILSVTDARSPYFVNSSIPIGRSVLNTAISRAKRRLVLVCDAAIWASHDDQMISELLKCTKKSDKSQ